MLSLEDLCLLYLTNHISSVKHVGGHLSRQHLELLLHRLSNQDMFTKDLFPSIREKLFSDRLREVTWTYNEQISDKVLSALSSCGCQLTKLKLAGLKNVTDKGLLSIGKHQKSLKSLILKDLKSITDKGFSTLQCPSLVKVKVTKCHVGDAGVIRLVKQNPNIAELSIARTKAADKAVLAVAKHLNKSLKSLDLTGLISVTDESISALGIEQCEKLQVLLLTCCSRITGTALKQVCSGCPDLRVIGAAYCFSIGHDDGRTSTVENFPSKLQELSLHGVTIHQNLLIDLAKNLSTITCLRLCGTGAVNEHSMEQICSNLGGSLTELDLSGCFDLEDSSLSSVCRHCTSLQVFAVSLSNITGTPLVPWLKKRGHLLKKFLASGCTKMSRATLEQVVLSCPSLEQFTVACSGFIDDDLLIMLSTHCQHLNYLNIKACRQVSDVGLLAVVLSCPLTELVVSGIRYLTDMVIFALACSCPDTLSSLYISGCNKITSEATEYLKARCVNKLLIERRVPQQGSALQAEVVEAVANVDVIDNF